MFIPHRQVVYISVQTLPVFVLCLFNCLHVHFTFFFVNSLVNRDYLQFYTYFILLLREHFYPMNVFFFQIYIYITDISIHRFVFHILLQKLLSLQITMTLIQCFICQIKSLNNCSSYFTSFNCIMYVSNKISFFL